MLSPSENQASENVMFSRPLGMSSSVRHAVFWTPTSILVQRLLAAKRDLRLPQELAKLDKYACVILDDIGYVQLDQRGRHGRLGAGARRLLPDAWDADFTLILAAGDPGESPLKGGLLVAKHGRGHFVYTGLVFFRQLPAGVPGAYRLFANLVSLGK